jgi:DUF218 domain
MRRALIVLGSLAAVWLAACAFLFLWPREESADRVDAVVVLAGDAEHRIPRGLELVEDGVADELVISTEPGEKWERWRPLCGRRAIVCFDARPYSTAGEAETVERLAARRGWRSIALVSSRYHIFRARMLFRRCLEGRVAAVGADYDRRWLPLILPLETAKLVHALTVDRDC